MPKWKVEIRDNCKICGKPLPNSRYRTYCSPKCRENRNNQKQVASGYTTAWHKARRDAIASVPDPDKCRCLICGKWYVQPCSHAYHAHGGITGREYREYFELEVKRGVVPPWYRKLKGNIALDNGTYKNLEAGAKFRFRSGDKRAGNYVRSPITIERLKNLHKLKKN